MVRERTGEQLDAWLKAVEVSHLEAFQTFVTGVQKDKDAVLAGLTLSCSNDPLEGHVNRLKLIKRSMYGRAEFESRQASSAPSEQAKSGQKEQGQAQARTTGGLSEETQDDEKRHKFSAYHNWH